MKDENQNKDKLNKILKSPIILVVVLGIIITILYYIMSPYQICMRDVYDNSRRCQQDTNW